MEEGSSTMIDFKLRSYSAVVNIDEIKMRPKKSAVVPSPMNLNYCKIRNENTQKFSNFKKMSEKVGKHEEDYCSFAENFSTETTIKAEAEFEEFSLANNDNIAENTEQISCPFERKDNKEPSEDLCSVSYKRFSSCVSNTLESKSRSSILNALERKLSTDAK